jgi:quinoprotein glucose dehydrogenase
VSFALPDETDVVDAGGATSPAGWLDLFDGATLDGWVHLNGGHTFTVEDGAIVGRTVTASASMNSFLCTTREFSDFELELETMVDRVTNQGIQVRSRVKPVSTGRGFENSAGRVHGRRSSAAVLCRASTTGLLWRALGTGGVIPADDDAGHRHFVDEGWNRVRIVLRGPRIQTGVNGHLVEDLVNEAVYRTHPSGFIGLQIHGLSQREIDLPINAGSGVSVHEPLVNRWRGIRIRTLRGGMKGMKFLHAFIDAGRAGSRPLAESVST